MVFSIRKLFCSSPLQVIGKHSLQVDNFQTGSILTAVAATMLVGIFTLPVLAQPKPIKVFIAVDMEGIAGVVSGNQLTPKGFEYERFRRFLTAETLAAVNAIRKSGAAEIVVCDSHFEGQNLLIEEFPEDVTIVRSTPAPLDWLQGLDGSFDGVILIGFHASTTSLEGVRAHTISSGRFADVKINGSSMSETTIAAAVSGHFGVPIILLSGDDAAIAEAQRVLPDMEMAVTKWAYGFHSARTLTPAAAQKIIAVKTAKAIERLRAGDFKPYSTQKPVRLELRFKHYRPAEVLAYLPFVERPDSHSIRYVATDMLQAMKFLAFVEAFNIELEP